MLARAFGSVLLECTPSVPAAPLHPLRPLRPVAGKLNGTKALRWPAQRLAAANQRLSEWAWPWAPPNEEGA
jgi:hypothetical protein